MAFWYCKAGDKEVGPYSAKQLKALADAGKLQRQTPVRDSDSGEWSTAGKVSGVFPPIAKALPLDAGPAPAAPAAVAPRQGTPVATATPPRGVAITPAPAVHDTARLPAANTVAMGIAVTPAAGPPVVRAPQTPKPIEDSEAALPKYLGLVAIGIGALGLALCLVPFAGIACGVVGTLVALAALMVPGANKSTNLTAVGGALAGIAAIGAGGYILNSRPDPDEVAAEQAAAEAATIPADKVVDEAEMDARAAKQAQSATESPVAAAASASPRGADAPKPSTASKSTPAQRKLAESVSRFSKAPYASVKVLGDRQVRVTAAWYTANPSRPLDVPATSGTQEQPAAGEGAAQAAGEDTASEPAAPGEDVAGAPSDDASPPSALGEASAPAEAAAAEAKYLCVEVQVTNVGKAAWKFVGWTASADKAASLVVLIDAEGNLFAPVGVVPLGASAASGTALKSGEMARIGLVFAAPESAAAGFKIALSGGGIGAQTPIGFAISPQVLATGLKPPTAVAAQPSKVPPASTEEPPIRFETEPAPVTPEQPAGEAPPGEKPEAPGEDEPPDIRKQIEEAAKRDRERHMGEPKKE